MPRVRIPVHVVDSRGNPSTDRTPSFGPDADTSPAAQARRRARGTAPLPESFTFSARTLPADFFAALSDSLFHVRPSAVAVGPDSATKVISALLYYAQHFCHPLTREYILKDFRHKNVYDGDMLSELMRVITRDGAKGGMDGYDGYADPGDMWGRGVYYTADGAGFLDERERRRTRQRS